MDDQRTDRDRTQDLRGRLDALRGDRAPRLVAQVGRVYNAGSMPSSTGKFFALHPVALTGAEAEGGALSQAPALAQDLVYVIGSRVPVAGDGLIYYQVGDRWVAESGKGGTTSFTVNVLGCTGGGLGGALVQVKDGATVLGTCTTGFSGCTMTGLPAGTWDLVISAPCYTTSTTSITLPSSTVTKTLTLLDSCTCGGACCGSLAIPNTLTLTSPYVGCALTWDGTSKWVGSEVASGVAGIVGPSCTGGTGTAAFGYELQCVSGIFRLTISACQICNGFIFPLCVGGSTVGSCTGEQVCGCGAEDVASYCAWGVYLQCNMSGSCSPFNQTTGSGSPCGGGYNVHA